MSIHMIDEKQRRHQFATWLNQQLQQRSWTQGKLILESGTSENERLSSAAVSRYSTGKMLPDIVSIQKIARALDLPIEYVLRKASLIDPLPAETDWIQRAIDDLVNAVEAGQLTEEGRLALVSQIRRERHLQELQHEKELPANNQID